VNVVWPGIKQIL